MKAYLCNTPNGKRVAGTQADAKALDKGFKEHEVPTDKAGLLEYINDLFEWAEERVASANDSYNERDEQVATTVTTDRPGDCPACHRSAVAADMAANTMALTDIEDAVFFLTDVKMLDRVLDAVEDRRRELEGEDN